MPLNFLLTPLGVLGREVGGEPVANQLPRLVGQPKPLHARLGAQRARDLWMHGLDPLDRWNHPFGHECSSIAPSLEFPAPEAGTGAPDVRCFVAVEEESEHGR